MKIEILGASCLTCKALESLVNTAVTESEKEIEVIKVNDVATMLEYGVISTPALVIDGHVIAKVKNLGLDEVIALIEK